MLVTFSRTILFYSRTKENFKTFIKLDKKVKLTVFIVFFPYFILFFPYFILFFSYFILFFHYFIIYLFSNLGAKYGPCMRNDSNIFGAIQKDIALEKETACCIRNDRGGCVQSDQKQCVKLMSQWHKWNTTEFTAPSDFNGVPRTSGSVCGLDPM